MKAIRLLTFTVLFFLGGPQEGVANDSTIPYVLNWRRLVEGSFCSPVAVADSLLYLGSTDCYAYCLRARNGTVRWRYRTGRANFLAGLTGTLALIGSSDGYLHAVDQLSGESVWRLPIRKISTEAAVRGDRAFFGTAEGYLYAVDLHQGSVLWRVKAGGAVTTTPTVDSEAVYWGTESGFYAATKSDGFLKWSFHVQAMVRSRPILWKGMVLWGGDDGYFYAVDAQSGTLLWKRRTGGQIKSSPAVHNGRVFLGSTNGWVYALDLAQGKPVWKCQVEAPVGSAVCLGPGDMLFAGDNRGVLHTINTREGRKMWSFSTSGSIETPPVVDGYTLYFRSGDGYLYSLNLKPESARWNANFLWEDWGEQFYKDKKIGYFHEAAQKAKRGVRLWTRQVNWEGGFRQSFSERLMDPDGHLLFFEDRRVEDSQVLTIRGWVKRDSLLVEKRLDGQVLRKTLYIGKDAVASEVAEQLFFNRGALSVGDSRSFPSFDYDSLSRCNLLLTVVGEDTLQWRQKSLPVAVVYKTCDLPEMEGIEVQEWVSSDGKVLRVECPQLRVSLRVTSQKQALQWHEFEEKNTIPADVSIEMPIKVNCLNVRLTTSPLLLKRIPFSDQRQILHFVSDSTVEIEVKRVAAEASSSAMLPIDTSGLKAFLQPTLFIQCTHPLIVKTAERVVGNERDPWRATKRLLEWVYNNMNPKQTNVRFKSALEVLETMEGTCSEYTVLFVALARAVGIPARVCAGLMASGKQSFGLHMWAQVYVGRWIDVDPSCNQISVDATHIKLASSSLALEQLPRFNVPISLALVHIDTIRVVSYQTNGQVELTAARHLWEKISRLRAEFQDTVALKLLGQLYALPRNSRSDDALYQMGEILLDKGELAKAKNKFDRLLEEFPRSELADNALFQLGKIWQKQGRPDSAQAFFLRLVEEFPNSELADDALYKAGLISEKAFSQFQSAERLYRRLIEEYEQSGWASCAQEALTRCAESRHQKQAEKANQ